MRIVLWGTYDTGKPRIRIIRDGLRHSGAALLFCHADVWTGIADKSQICGVLRKFTLLMRWLVRYPGLIYRYLCLPEHDAVIVGYLGHLDVLVLRPFARLRGKPVVWDAFVSLYNTVVEDRNLLAPAHPLAKLLYAWEWLACRAADMVVLDTASHADYFIQTFGLKQNRVRAIFVGAEDSFFYPDTEPARMPQTATTVLFYGQYIPLHGIATIIEAAWLTRTLAIDWVLIGTGQESDAIQAKLACGPACRVRLIEWVDYEKLRQHINSAGICLGIFGTGDKAARVIPNKVFQALLCGKPLITRDSPAIRELLAAKTPGIMLVPAGDAQALADAVTTFSQTCFPENLHQNLQQRISVAGIGGEWVRLLKSATLKAE